MMRLPLPLLALIMATAAPIVAGWALYLNPKWLPDTRSHYGQLVQPPLPLGLQADRPAGVRGGHWRLLLSVPECGSDCRQQVATLQGVRRALGEDRRRLHGWLLVGTESIDMFSEPTGKGTPSPLSRSALHARLQTVDIAAEGALFVIDPVGNLMMRYPPEVSGKALLGDLERLMNLSRHWGNDERG